jgi:hypothetical protein
MTSILPSTGFHYGVPYEDYAAWDAINFSRLKAIRKTASKCKYEIDNPKKQTAAMVLGSAFHVAILEPGRFDQMFYICPKCDGRTTAGKLILNQAIAEAAKLGKTMLREGVDDESLGEIGKLRGAAKAIHGRKIASLFLDEDGRNEVSMLWKDKETGLMCKGRLDKLIEEPREPVETFSGGNPVIVECKTSRDAAEWQYAKDVDNFDYDAQSACYCEGVRSITGKTPKHVFLVAESFAPFDCAEYTLTDRSLNTGLLKYRTMLKKYAECVKSGIWPGYPEGLKTLDLPGYAHERNYD